MKYNRKIAVRVLIIASLPIIGTGASQLWQHHPAGWYLLGVATLLLTTGIGL